MSFSTSIAKFSKGTKDKVQAIRRGVTLKLFSAVVMDTPVLSGRLRGNWRVSEGQPDTKADEREDKGGQIVMGEIQTAVQASQGDTEMYLTNSLPYAARIEFDGWSHTKAPEGMVRKNVARFNQLIRVEASKK